MTQRKDFQKKCKLKEALLESFPRILPAFTKKTDRQDFTDEKMQPM